MPALAAFFGSIVLQLVKFFAQYVAKRFAVTLAVITSTVAAWAVMWGAITAALSAARVVMPTPLASALSLVQPTGFSGIVAAWISVELALAAYRWFKDTEKFAANYEAWKL